MCYVDIEKAFDRVPRKVIEQAITRSSVVVIDQAVMSLYDGAKTNVRAGSVDSEKFKVKVGVHQGSVSLPLLFTIVVDVITEKARRGVLNEILYADDLVLMSKTVKDLKEDFGISWMHWRIRV